MLENSVAAGAIHCSERSVYRIDLLIGQSREFSKLAPTELHDEGAAHHEKSVDGMGQER
jgi:hypothetical protein